MTEPPTYTVATDSDEIKQLREVIDALRANNGRLLRLLIKRLSNETLREISRQIIKGPTKIG